MMKRALYLCIAIMTPTLAVAVHFGALTSFTDVERIEFFTSSQGGGVDIVYESSYNVITPYEGVYLWARNDRRLDSLSYILPNDGIIMICHSGTPGWNSGWWYDSHYFPEGEKNHRPINNMCYADMFTALITRYGSSGIRQPALGRAVTNWSLWGEPDGGMRMMGQHEYEHSSGASDIAMIEYFTIASLATERIRTIDPAATIISGSFLSPASPPPGGESWEVIARDCLQLCFSGEKDRYNPVEFRWPEGPDVFDWHPYDDFEQRDCDWESYYDPLVIDEDDLMYRERCDALANGSLDNYFDGSEPSWSTMPQYLLEFCPTYTLDEWRVAGTIPTTEFHSTWRANYHITSCLMLAESSHLEVLTPWLAGSGQWWACLPGVSSFICVPIEDLWPSDADLSYQFLTAKLNKTVCQEFTSENLEANLEMISTQESTYRLAHWTFQQEATIGTPRVHALRTYREGQFDLYDEDLEFTVKFQVPQNVESLEQYTLLGVHEGILIPDDSGIVTIDVNGYVCYAIENLQSITTETQIADSHYLSPSPESRGFRLRLFDLTGRLVLSQYINSVEQVTVGNMSPFLNKYTLPDGHYFAAIYDESNQMLMSRKVLVTR